MKNDYYNVYPMGIPMEILQVARCLNVSYRTPIQVSFFYITTEKQPSQLSSHNFLDMYYMFNPSR